MNEDIIHEPYTDGDAGAFKGAYVIVHFKNGAHQMKYMSKYEIDAHRKRSKSSNSNYSPWATDYAEMAKKTVFRNLFKWLPISIEQAMAVANDESVVRMRTDAATASSVEDMIEADFVMGEDVVDEPVAEAKIDMSEADSL